MDKTFLITFSCVIISALFVPTGIILPENEPSGFYAVNTSFGVSASRSSDFPADFERSQEVFAHLAKLDVHAMSESYIVLPETIVGRANPISIEFWKSETDAKKGRHKACSGALNFLLRRAINM